MCSIQNPLFTLHIFNSAFSLLLTVPYPQKGTEELGEELESISGKSSPDICCVVFFFFCFVFFHTTSKDFPLVIRGYQARVLHGSP